MKTLLKTVITSTLFLLANSVMSQRNNVIIQGSIDIASFKEQDSKDLYFHISDINNFGVKSQIYEAPVSLDGKFRISLNLPSNLTYISFEVMNDRKILRELNSDTRKTASFLSDIYLFESGDSVNVDIRNDGMLLFEGKGSDKLNCQNYIYNIQANTQSKTFRLVQLNNTKKNTEMLEFDKKMLDLTRQMRLTVLDSYKSRLRKEIYERIYLDAIASCYISFIQNAWKKSDIDDREKNLELLYEVYNDQISRSVIWASAYYPMLVLELEIYNYRLCNFSRLNLNGTNVLEVVYTKIKNKYNGEMRDKMIYLCFKNLARYNLDEAKSLATEAQKVIENSECRSLLEGWRNEQFALYPFALKNPEGKTYTLDSFKGKVLIVDFWYTGCSACVSLNKAMAPIVKKYKDNPNVVFCTISVDAKKEIWMKSIKSGKYTSTESVNLYTNGQGITHPFIKNYNFKSYPSQFIIDKTGSLITSAPPRPDCTESGNIIDQNTTPDAAIKNTMAFIRIIETALENNFQNKL